MSEKNLVICDSEIRYANSLAENITTHAELAVKVYICSSLEKVFCLLLEKRIHILIVDEKYAYDERSKIEANQIFVLSKGKVADLGKDECAICKYQCADEIIRNIFEVYVEKTQESIFWNARKNRTKIIAVYSPIHRIGKTRFAIALGKEFAKKEQVLYLNAEEYAGFVETLEEEFNLADLLYYVKQGNHNLATQLRFAVHQIEELDYILPVPISQDLKEIHLKEWKILLEQIIENSSYELLILDIGESVQGLFQILEMCDRVYMPILKDEVSERKLQQYQKNLEQLKLEKLPHITYQFVMPENVEEYAKIRIKEEC